MKEIQEYLDKKDWRILENANTNFSISGLRSYISNTGLAKHLLGLSPARNYHINGSLHIHDLDGGICSYCSGHDVGLILEKGISNIGGTSSHYAKHLDTALDHCMNFLYAAQQEFNGAQAFSNFDVYMSPFVRKDKLDYNGVKQTIQRYIYNLNFPLRTNYQTVFSNITLGFNTSNIKDNHVIIDGKLCSNVYDDYKEEIEIFDKALLDIMISGDDKEQPFTFPLITVDVDENFDWESRIANKLIQYSIKYGGPYYSNYCGTNLSKSDRRSMCCRLQLDNADIKEKNGLWDINGSTGSIGVCTINLANAAMVSNRDEDKFFERLNLVLNAAKEQSLFKRSLVNDMFDNGLYPFISQYIKGFDTYFNTIGIIGCNEACVNLFGSDIWANEKFSIKVMNFILNKLNQYKSETNQLWNLEQTPCEGATYRLAKTDIKRFPTAYTQGTKDSPYYTTGTSLPVSTDIGLVDRIKFEEKTLKLYTGGSIFHIFSDSVPSVDAIKSLLSKILSHSEIPYLTFSPTRSICHKCGLLYGKYETCPNCKSICDIYSRVVGYYRPVKNWNIGKKMEFIDRRDMLNVEDKRR